MKAITSKNKKNKSLARESSLDQSEREIEESELFVSQQRAQLALDAGEMGVFEWFVEEERSHFDERTRKFLGLDEKIFDVSDRDFFSAIHPDDLDKTKSEIFSSLKNRDAFEVEFRVAISGGKFRWLHSFGRRKPESKSGSVHGVIFDITERKISEERLQQYKLITEKSGDLVVFNNFEGKLIFVNPAFCKALGYAREELLGMKVEDVYPGFSRRDKKASEALGEGESLVFNTELRRRDGTSFPVEIVVTKVSFGGEIIFGSNIRDLSERERRDERIRQQASLLDLTQDAVLVCDLNNQVLFWNKGAEKIYGWSSEEVLGREIGDLMHGEAKFEINSARKTLESKNEWNATLRQNTKNGGQIFVESRWTLVRNEKDQPDFILIVNTDITDKRRTEAQLLRAQRMESVGTLAGGIAHDLNNILAPILLATDMLHLNAGSEESRRWLEIIRQNAERGSDLIKQVLTFARGMEGERISVQLKHLIKDLVKILRETFPKSIAVTFEIDPELSLVSIDPTQINQVLMNLAVNARDAMPEGGKLHFSAKNIAIDENYARLNPDASAGEFVLISVSDTGEGIPTEIQPKIFDPFFTTKEVGKGTGLGLATAQSIVKSHEGFITVYSEPGNGTKFSVYLPTTGIRKVQTDERVSLPYPKGKGELILLVDDEKNVLQITTETLEKFGYRVLPAADGTEAISAFNKNKDEVALVLTDLAMPNIDGFETIRVLRSVSPALPMIATSGLAGTDRSSELQALGVGNFLSKPYTAENLLIMLDDILHK